MEQRNGSAEASFAGGDGAISADVLKSIVGGARAEIGHGVTPDDAIGLTVGGTAAPVSFEPVSAKASVTDAGPAAAVAKAEAGAVAPATKVGDHLTGAPSEWVGLRPVTDSFMRPIETVVDKAGELISTGKVTLFDVKVEDRRGE